MGDTPIMSDPRNDSLFSKVMGKVIYMARTSHGGGQALGWMLKTPGILCHYIPDLP